MDRDTVVSSVSLRIIPFFVLVLRPSHISVFKFSLIT